MAKDVDEGKGLAGLMYLVTIFGLLGIIVSIIIWAIKKDNKFIDYQFKQLLTLWIFSTVVTIIGIVTSFILVGIIILIAGGIFFFILWIIGMVNGFTGKKQPLPVIGKYGEKWFKF
ncbi:DUF4870 domain-containing protein [Nanoarchaeota archaeon]